ncbi:SLC13 family permease [Coralliovum pocilloporae]|uniref:SLC13 family permease n=1 Tax=Coralliovum pocilloporae TaxID=3066369 RepID=UPI00330720A9
MGLEIGFFMSFDQIALFSLFGLVFVFLLWGRFRYDLVAFCALLIALLLGLVPKEDAFSGFGHPATVIVALVLIVSRGLINSGAIDVLTRHLIDPARGLPGHISLIGGLGGLLSGFMNNVAALALLMPVEIQASKRAGRAVGLTLMPLAFATILGGLFTLIGTPPNIIIAAFREQALGQPFAMFDFAPVGLICAVVGIAFIALVGWRLIPRAGNGGDGEKAGFEIENYIAELLVPEGSGAVGQRIADLDDTAEEADAALIGLVRNGKRKPGRARLEEIAAGDILVVEARPDAIDRLRGLLTLEYAGEEYHAKAAAGGMSLIEVVVPRDARIDGRSALSLGLLYRQGVTLLGVSRQGRKFRNRVRKLPIEAGDVLLLLGPSERLSDVTQWLGCLPLAERGLSVTQRSKALPAALIFAAAIALASFGLVYLPVALACAAVLYVLLNIVPLREVYDQIEWPVVVLLGSMIPLGSALEQAGGTGLIASGIITLTDGYTAPVVLALLMVVTMTLSDVLNNTATTVIAAPIAIEIAQTLQVNPDAFLMGVAISASCAFLTPIGHKNNTLIMGPGGYAFGDYWRMGLPLELIVIAVAVPSILFFWPL